MGDESSEDEFELVPKSVDNYWLEDVDENPISFATLPYSKTDDDSLPDQVLFLRGTQDNGMRLFVKALAWRLDLTKPAFQVKTEKYWIGLSKPRKSYEGTIRSVMIVAEFLNYALLNPDQPEKAAWSHLNDVFSSFEVRPSQNDLSAHFPLIQQLITMEKGLAGSRALESVVAGSSKNILPSSPKETKGKEVDVQKQLFDDYLVKFSKQYSPREREVRFSYFVASCKEIAEINEQQGHTVAGFNVFSDRSESELDFMRGCHNLLPEEFYSAACANTPLDLSATNHESESPTSSSSVDWVKAGVVSPQVRSQCQDQCWANASIECVESKVRIDSARQSKEKLSVQQVVDCLFDRPKTSTSVFLYGMEKGFLREEDYPITGPPKTCESEGCSFLHKPRVFLTSLLPADMRSNEIKLKECLKKCPQFVTIGNDSALRHYTGGIITSCKCKIDTENHAVLLCGCGKQDRIKYWRFKNSWGEAWGERGFFRLVRNKGMCRIGQFFNRPGKTKVSDSSFMKEPKSREDVKETKGGAGSRRVQSGCCSFCKLLCSWCRC